MTAAVAALAFLASLFQISENYRRSDASLKAERFGKALTLLSESRTSPKADRCVTSIASILPDDVPYRREAAVVHGFAKNLKYGPDFRCADLSGAQFSRHPVFRVHSS